MLQYAKKELITSVFCYNLQCFLEQPFNITPVDGYFFFEDEFDRIMLGRYKDKKATQNNNSIS